LVLFHSFIPPQRRGSKAKRIAKKSSSKKKTDLSYRTQVNGKKKRKSNQKSKSKNNQKSKVKETIESKVVSNRKGER